MQLLASTDSSKFYKMRKMQVKLDYESKLSIGKYLSIHKNHLEGLAFAFNCNPETLLNTIAGMYCYEVLQSNMSMDAIMGISFEDMCKKDIAFMVYKCYKENNRLVLDYIEKLDCHYLDNCGSKLNSYALSDLEANEVLYSQLNISVNASFIGLCVYLKQECSANHMCDVLIHLIPQLSSIELHLYLANNILYLFSFKPTKLSTLIRVYLQSEFVNESHLFSIASYDFYYKTRIQIDEPSCVNIFDYFKDNQVINHYIIYLVCKNDMTIPITFKQSVITFIMSLESWPIYFRTLLNKLDFTILEPVDRYTESKLPQIEEYYHIILEYCQDWLVLDDPIRHGFFVQSILAILKDYYTLDLSQLLIPYLHTTFKSNKSTFSNGLEIILNQLSQHLPAWSQPILYLLYQWSDVLPKPFFQLLQDAIAYFYVPTYPIQCKSLDLTNVDTSDTNLRSCLINAYFKAKSLYSKVILTDSFPTTKISFMLYFKDLPFYFDIMDNIYEKIHMYEGLLWTNSNDLVKNQFVMDCPFTFIADYKAGISSMVSLSEWDNVSLKSTQVDFNQCLAEICNDFPLDVFTLKQIDSTSTKYSVAVLNACRLQNKPLLLPEIPSDFESQFAYVKYLKPKNPIASLMRLENITTTTIDNSLSVKLQALKIKSLHKLESSSSILASYKELTDSKHPKCYKHCADYCNQIYTDHPSIELAKDIIRFYSKYLATNKDIEQTMVPRIITLFQKIEDNQLVADFLKVCEDNNFDHILPHVSLTSAFLMSEKEYFADLISQLLTGCLKFHCKSIGWQIMSSCFSTNSKRSSKMHLLLKQYCRAYKMGSWMNSQVSTCHLLIQLSELTFSKQTSELYLSKDYRKLSKLIDLDIELPLLNNNGIKIHKFDDRITLLNSLVRPKKCKIQGNDGILYTLL